MCNDSNPTDWGRILKYCVLILRRMLKLPAPDCLLNTIFCKCVKGYVALCGYLKLSLDCSTVCVSCHGQSYHNSPSLESTVDENNISNNTSISSVNFKEHTEKIIILENNYGNGDKIEEEEEIYFKIYFFMLWNRLTEDTT